MKPFLLSWQMWALLSAAFAALTAIFAKVGGENVNSDFATFVRTVVILCALGGDAARVAPIDKLSVVLVALFSVAFLDERLSIPNWLGVALIAAGAVLVAYKG